MTTQKETSMFSLRDASVDEIAQWDALVQRNPDGGQWVQGDAYAALKRTERLHARRLVFERGQERVYALALEHRSLAGKFWYFTQGPGMDIAEYVGLRQTLEAARAGAARGVYAVKVEPFVLDTAEHRAILAAEGFAPDRQFQQNQFTVLVDLTPSTDDIFAGFSKNLRNHIRKAEKGGYRVEKVEASEATYRTMYELMKTVAGGKGPAFMKGYDYYRASWHELASRGQGHFWFGYDGAHEGPQASAFMIGYGKYAIAKDGGSVPDRAIRGGAHLMRWKAMQWFKEHDGRTVYDAYATPPSWQKDDREHYLWGPGQFKQLFGAISDHLPTHDLVLDAARHRFFMRLLLPIERRVRRRPYGIW